MGRPLDAESRGSGSFVVAALVLLLLLPVVYFLSTGPAIWFCVATGMDGAWLETVYAPLVWLHESCPPLQPYLDGYWELWR